MRDAGNGGRPRDLSYGLPFVDEYHVAVAADAAEVWRTLTGWAGQQGGGPREAYARLVGARPTAASGPALETGSTLPGMRVVESVPGCRAVLAGRHLYSRYALELGLEPAPGGSGTVLRAATYAAFPGPLGFVYRQLVIGSGVHGKLMRRLLAHLRDRAEGSPGVPVPPVSGHVSKDR
ncbi:hypothetical protein [Streptomyces spiralis]